jgi:hypothetical protein
MYVFELTDPICIAYKHGGDGQAALIDGFVGDTVGVRQL